LTIPFAPFNGHYDLKKRRLIQHDHNPKIRRSMHAVRCSLLLAACGPTETPEPTPDADMIRTAAVLTVEAELTQQALLNPTATNTVSPTPEPSPTSEVPTLMPIGEGTQAAGESGTTPALQTATQAPPPGATAPDKAEWVSNSPADGTTLQPGQRFEIRWTVKNSGTTTWNTSYSVRFFSGNITTDKSLYNLRSETKPDGTAEIIVDATAPNDTRRLFHLVEIDQRAGRQFWRY
jgi:hypothetical protein